MNDRSVSNRFEVYWQDGAGELRGMKFGNEDMARGFIVGLRKDHLNRDIMGLDGAENRPFNMSELGGACDDRAGFPAPMGAR